MARVDPYKNYRFLVEIDGIVQAGFSECTGLGSSIEVIEYREGGDPATVRKLPGKATYPDIVLKRGLTDSAELYRWHASVLAGEMARRNGSVIVLDDVGAEKLRWNFFSAWPSKWDGPEFSAKGNEVAVETLTLACERIEAAQ
jgi:phage tail-like protein